MERFPFNLGLFYWTIVFLR